MTKSAWKKSPNTARPQRTLPGQGATLKADGRRNLGPKRKVKAVKKPKIKIKARRKSASGEKLGVPLPRKLAERVLR